MISKMATKTDPRSFENASEEIGGLPLLFSCYRCFLSSSFFGRYDSDYGAIDLCLFCWFWFCFLGFPSERITHSIFHLDKRKRFAGYRCFGDLSLINALIGA